MILTSVPTQIDISKTMRQANLGTSYLERGIIYVGIAIILILVWMLLNYDIEE